MADRTLQEPLIIKKNDTGISFPRLSLGDSQTSATPVVPKQPLIIPNKQISSLLPSNRRIRHLSPQQDFMRQVEKRFSENRNNFIPFDPGLDLLFTTMDSLKLDKTQRQNVNDMIREYGIKIIV